MTAGEFRMVERLYRKRAGLNDAERKFVVELMSKPGRALTAQDRDWAEAIAERQTPKSRDRGRGGP